MVEFARDAYFKTGSNLLDSIAVVHPFVISTLLCRMETAVGAVGEVRGVCVARSKYSTSSWCGASYSSKCFHFN